MVCRAIAAVSTDYVIGVDNKLPWRCKDDLLLFKQLTMGRSILMGRKTFESIGKLPGRNIIVLSKTMQHRKDAHFVRSFEEALQITKGDMDIVGGGEIYKLAIESGYVTEMIITHVETLINENKLSKVTRFPYKLICDFTPLLVLEKQVRDKDNQFDFHTVKYLRVKNAKQYKF